MLRQKIAELEASNAKLREELKRRILETPNESKVKELETEIERLKKFDPFKYNANTAPAVSNVSVTHPAPRYKVGKKMKQKKVMSPETRQKLRDSWAKRKAAKA